MVVKTSTGMMFEITRCSNNAFDLYSFEAKYVEEFFDMYQFIVGDLSNNILRLKGFSTNPKSNSFVKNIDKYIQESCTFRCPFYVLRRIYKEEEYEKLKKENKPVKDEYIEVVPIEKENFDKDSLILESTIGGNANIVLDLNRINQMPRGFIPKDLEAIKQEELQRQQAYEKTQKRYQRQKEHKKSIKENRQKANSSDNVNNTNNTNNKNNNNQNQNNPNKNQNQNNNKKPNPNKNNQNKQVSTNPNQNKPEGQNNNKKPKKRNKPKNNKQNNQPISK